jgi:hypothetical protein
MPYPKPTVWDWIRSLPAMIYWRFLWRPKGENHGGV